MVDGLFALEEADIIKKMPLARGLLRMSCFDLIRVMVVTIASLDIDSLKKNQTWMGHSNFQAKKSIFGKLCGH